MRSGGEGGRPPRWLQTLRADPVGICMSLALWAPPWHRWVQTLRADPVGICMSLALWALLPGASWRLLGPSGAFWRLLGPSGASWRLLATPGASPAPPGAPWRLLAPAGASPAPPGTIWRLLAPPGALWRLLAPSGASWRLLAPPAASWRLSGASWRPLAPPGASCGASPAPPGTLWRLLAPSGGQIEGQKKRSGEYLPSLRQSPCSFGPQLCENSLTCNFCFPKRGVSSTRNTHFRTPCISSDFLLSKSVVSCA